nr:adrenodoxin-like protein 2, mitochondrial isoform X1 [Ipomoea batatas]
MVLSNIHRLAHRLSLHSVAGKLSLLSVCRGYSTEKCCIPNLLIDSNSSNGMNIFVQQQAIMIQAMQVRKRNKDGEEQQIKVPLGMSMLEAAHENDIELEGACEGSLACSTCHVIVMDMEYYNKLEDPEDEENDMLDLAFGLTETSRLGCQIIAKPELNGIRLAIPAATRNFAVDGFKPKPH